MCFPLGPQYVPSKHHPQDQANYRWLENRKDFFKALATRSPDPRLTNFTQLYDHVGAPVLFLLYKTSIKSQTNLWWII